MEEAFIHLHAHSTVSNGTAFFESITTTKDYINIAKKYGVPAIALSEHGSVVNWVKKKREIEEAGLKYIHSIEAYVTDDDDTTEKKTRDNYHLLLIAKNYDGVREINKLSSKSYYRNDNHYYYAPRMYREDIFNTSDNILILTACLGSPLRKSPYQDKWLEFFIKNKHRVWLEVQPHVDDDQREYNKWLLELADKHDMRIIATNDVHNINPEQANVASAIKQSKGIHFDNDDVFETYYKSTDEMMNTFIKQDVLRPEQISKALYEPYNVIEQIEDFTLDFTFKYPEMFDKEKQTVGGIDINYLPYANIDNVEKAFKALILDGFYKRGIHKLDSDTQKSYQERIKHELKVYKEVGAIDYMLLEWAIKKLGREKVINPDKSIFTGYGRGSVSGSLIAFLLEITEMDALKHNLVFERFMNPDRISLADIDTDLTSEDRYQVMYYLLTMDILNCASIMTKNTYATKGAIKAYGRTMGYTPAELNEITKSIDPKTNEIPRLLYNEHKELFDKAASSEGSIDSFGRHAAGILVTTRDIEAELGTMTLSNWDYAVTQLDMKDIDYTNYVKLDVLGLDNIELIQKTGNKAGIGYLTPESDIDFQDEKVWRSMADDNVGIFQFESDRAGSILGDMFSHQTLERIKSKNPDVQYIDLLSLANAAQRPSGASYIEDVTNGVFKDNGHKALNEFLAPTMGQLVYQEQQIQFLTDFCNWSAGQADLLRRGIGKKNQQIMDEEVPKIKEAFVNTMIEKYGDSKEHAEQVADDFVQVFIDSANYGFSINHSLAYSYIGYISAYLRYYYPLEFVASGLEIWTKGDKNIDFLRYAEKHGITIKPPKFRKSEGGYGIDREENAIYEGTGHIKGGNESVGDILYQLKDREYNCFTDLVLDIIENGELTIHDERFKSIKTPQDLYHTATDEDIKVVDSLNKEGKVDYTYNSLGINKTKMEGLIKLKFFEEFGSNKKLWEVYEYVNDKYNPNNKTFKNKFKKYQECVEFEKSLPDKSYSISEQCEIELYYTGRAVSSKADVPSSYFIVSNIYNVGKTRTTAEIYSLSVGESMVVKVGSKVYKNAPFKEGDILELHKSDIAVKPKNIKKDGEWVKSPTEKEFWAKKLKFIRKGIMR